MDFVKSNNYTFQVLMQLGESPILVLELFRSYIVMLVKSWISALWLATYVMNDQLVTECFMVGVILNLVTFITKEAVFQTIRIGVDVKYWAFSRVWNHVTDLGVFDIIQSAFGFMLTLRLFLNIIGLPNLLRVDTFYVFIVAIIYSFYVVITSFQRTVRYHIELKIEANVNVKSDEIAARKFSLKDHFGFFLISYFWLMVPFMVRIYRKGFTFRPFKDLIAPSKFKYFLTLITLPIFMIITICIDFLVNLVGWLTIYLWVYPYLFNKRMSEMKWNALMESIDTRSSVIHCEVFNDKDGYLYNLIRSYAVWLGWFKPDAEFVVEESEILIFFRDIFQGFPTDSRKYWVRKYKIPWAYLKNHKLRPNMTPDEICNIYINGLRSDGERIYGRFPHAELFAYTKGSTNPAALSIAEQTLSTYCQQKFGCKYVRNMELFDDFKDKYVEVMKPPPGDYYFSIDDVIPPNDLLDDGIVRFTKVASIDDVKGEAYNKVDNRLPLVWNHNGNSLIGQTLGREYAITVERIDTKDIYAVTKLGVKWGFPRLTDLDSDFSRTVCCINSLLAGLNLAPYIEMALLSDDPSTVVIKEASIDPGRTKYLLYDGYYRLRTILHVHIRHEEEPVILEEESNFSFINEGIKRKVEDVSIGEPDFVDLDKLDFSTVINTKSLRMNRITWLPEYRDYSVIEYTDIAKKLSKVTTVPGSILTQLAHIHKFADSVPTSVRLLYNKYESQINEWATLPYTPVYLYGGIYGQGALNSDDCTLILESLYQDKEIYIPVMKWLETFEQHEFPRVMFWFVSTNLQFLQRFLTVDCICVLVQSYKFNSTTHINVITPIETKKLRLSDYSHLLKGFQNPFKRFQNFLQGPQNIEEDDKYIEMSLIRTFNKYDFDYENMSKIMIQETREKSMLKGLELVGKQSDYSSPTHLIKYNKTMVDLLVSMKSGLPLNTYIVVNPTSELILNGLEKYKRKKFDIDFNSEYQGVTLKEWLFTNLDYFYHLNRSSKFHIRPISSFSLDDLSDQSKKASAGFLSGREGIKNKATRLDFSKEWAQDYRRSILADKPLDHVWMCIPIGKTCKPEAKEIRMVNAPEMYFYINQYMLMEPFVTASKKSLVTNNFSIFFGEFDKCVRNFLSNDMKESLDLKSMGGSIQREIKDLFLSWYSRFLEDSNDIRVLRHILNDIFSATFMIPANYGGYVFKKYDGWCDGPYGTGDFDTWTMVVYYLINCWMNMKSNQISLSDFNPRQIHIESHGDNWLHSYPQDLGHIYSWNTKNLEMLGQKVKGAIERTSDMEGIELMGFYVKLVNGIYVGHRPLAKTIKSLVYNRKAYSNSNTQSSYIKGIILSLLLTDCWDHNAYSLLSSLNAKLSNVEPLTVDIESRNRVFLVESLNYNPREAWQYRTDHPIRESEKDPLNFESWWGQMNLLGKSAQL